MNDYDKNETFTPLAGWVLVGLLLASGGISIALIYWLLPILANIYALAQWAG